MSEDKRAVEKVRSRVGTPPRPPRKSLGPSDDFMVPASTRTPGKSASDLAASVLVGRALRGAPAQAKLQRFDSADDMCIPSSRSTKEPSIEERMARERLRGPWREHKTAAEAALVAHAICDQPQLRRFDSADYFTALAQDKKKDEILDENTFTRVKDEIFEDTSKTQALLRDISRQSASADPPSDTETKAHLSWTLCMVALVLRWGVSLHPYSGEATPPRYGDYEAHRHWMEVTIHLPLEEWYRYDLDYWGLDYPPVMAYIEYLLGLVSSRLEPASVDFESSRGHETPSHRSFMRGTVLFFDSICILWPLYLLLWRHPERLALALSSPALIMVDHAHFQYNSIPIGCTVWSLWALEHNRTALAALFFSLACNSKQTALYYAPAVFLFLLFDSKFHFISLFKIALTTICTFGLVWFPFLYTHSTTDALSRLFPVDRGIFEDKVGNFWYAAQVFLRARDKLSQALLIKIATGLTAFFAFIPCGFSAFLLYTKKNSLSPHHKSTVFALALHVSALAFFLFSYHVHEKAILVPLVPLLLVPESPPLYTSIFSLTAAASLLPLIVFEQSTMAYLPVLIIHILALDYFWKIHGRHRLFRMALLPFLLIHLIPLLYRPPSRFPHLYPALLALASAAIFGLSYLASAFRLISISLPSSSAADRSVSSGIVAGVGKRKIT